jgi:hypothetical protein
MPRPGHRYRCHVCRLELTIDEATHRMAVPPLEDGREDHTSNTVDGTVRKSRKRR